MEKHTDTTQGQGHRGHTHTHTHQAEDEEHQHGVGVYRCKSVGKSTRQIDKEATAIREGRAGEMDTDTKLKRRVQASSTPKYHR